MAYYGLQLIADDARAFTAYATSGTTNGDLMCSASSTDAVGSGIDTYVTSDIKAGPITDAVNCIGIALTDAVSGAPVAVATRAICILPIGSAAPVIGELVCSAGYGNRVVSGSVAPIGRCLATGTANTGYAIVKLTI